MITNTVVIIATRNLKKVDFEIGTIIQLFLILHLYQINAAVNVNVVTTDVFIILEIVT